MNSIIAKTVSVRLIVLIVAVTAIGGALTATSAHAQGAPSLGNGERREHKKGPSKADEQKTKVDEKAYDAALKSVPEKSEKPDPWRGVR